MTRLGTMTLRTRTAVGVLAAALLVVVPAGTVLADPLDPTDQDVRAAQGAVIGAQMSVASMEVRLAQQSADRDTAIVAVQQAGEAYTRAEADRLATVAAAQTAADRFAAANDEAETARRELVSIARQSARSGGEMDSVQAMLSSEGFAEVVDRNTALERVSTKADEVVQKYRAAQLVATTLQGRAEAAVATQVVATQAAKDALAAAEKTQADSEAALAAAAIERDGLIAQLAAARSTSAAVEQARQDRIEQDRQTRADAAARAQRTTVPAASTPATGAVTTTPVSTGPVTTAPVTTTPPASTTPAAPPVVAAPPVTTTPPAAATPVVTAPVPAAPSTANGLGTGTSRGSASSGAAAVSWATSKAGLAYSYGATGATTFDCSGLTMRAWQAAGVNLNRTSRDQYKQVLKISYDDLRPGDLVFWSTDTNDANAIYHVAMWVGNGQIMEAPRAGVPLRVTSMRWTATMPYAGRP